VIESFSAAGQVEETPGLTAAPTISSGAVGYAIKPVLSARPALWCLTGDAAVARPCALQLAACFRPGILIHPLAAEGNVKDTPGLIAASAPPLPLLLLALLPGAGELPGGPPGSSGGGLLNFASGPVRGTLGELLIFMSAGFAWKPALRMETCVGTTVIRDGACKKHAFCSRYIAG